MSFMVLIDFTSEPRVAFRQGFLKGLGAPVVLFGKFSAPQLPVVQQVAPAAHAAAISEDWAKIGADVRIATIIYGKEARAAK